MNPSPQTLIQRAATVTVGDILIQCSASTGLDIEFHVRKSLMTTMTAQKPKPNSCDLKLYNLTESHRKDLSQATQPKTTPTQKTKIVPVIISAGYAGLAADGSAGRQSVIFSGELRSANNVTDGPTVTTELTTGDGDQALTQQRLSTAIAPGTPAATVVQTLVNALGIGAGNLAKATAMINGLPLAAQLFAYGAVMKGNPAEILTDLCRALGLQWCVANGALQIQQLGQPLGGQSLSLSSKTGLVGSPSVDTKGILSFTTLMIPELKPGVVVVMNAKEVQGNYMVISCEWVGAKLGNEWYVKCEGQRY